MSRAYFVMKPQHVLLAGALENGNPCLANAPARQAVGQCGKDRPVTQANHMARIDHVRYPPGKAAAVARSAIHPTKLPPFFTASRSLPIHIHHQLYQG